MERSFASEIESLKLGAGQVFEGEGILAVTKALLQAGVSYVGGYQGAPVSHLLDVMVQARDYLDTLGVHVEACTNEASAAALLGASVHYPVRGAVTWKSIVGTNVAADALSSLASTGVTGGALIVSGGDYGEGASVVQERTHAFAMKSSMWLLDPRPSLPNIVRMTEAAFELSEASSTPVIMELRIRACHLRGQFECEDNRAPTVSSRAPLAEPAPFSYPKLAHPPVTFAHERAKLEERLPAARRHVVAHALNECFDAEALSSGAPLVDVGIVVQGGLYNAVVRGLQSLGLADTLGRARVPVLCLNVVHPLVPEQFTAFCAGKRAVLVVEEGSPEFIEKDLIVALRRADLQTEVDGKSFLSAYGEYTGDLVRRGLRDWLAHRGHGAACDPRGAAQVDALERRRARARELLAEPVPARPPGFCVGCPERPVFSAMKQVREDIGEMHVAADIGCHALATFEPFSMGHTILGYGMSLAAAAGVGPIQARRPVAVMGDGGFWHNGLLSGVASNLLNRGDGVLIVMKNGYTSATGTQDVVSTPTEDARRDAGAGSATATDDVIERTLQGMGVKWLRTVHTYRVAEMKRTFTEAMTTAEPGLKVIVAEGECQLERQRRIRPQVAAQLAAGERVVKVRYGVDEDVCTGDHACVRLSGCPALTVRDAADPLRVDPVAHVTSDCVGCGLCGENAHSAGLCPSFHRIEVVQNPTRRDRAAEAVRGWLRRALFRLTAPRGARA